MKRDAQITRFARKLVELSKEDGVVTEANVAEVLAGLKRAQHRYHLAILKTYLSYLRREIARQTAVVSTPVALTEETLQSIQTQFSQQYGRPISVVTQQDDSLIAGIRVRIGDDLYDASLSGRLQRLAETVK